MPDPDRLRLLWARLRQQLWWRPALWSAGAVTVAIASALADVWRPPDWLPEVRPEVLEDLLRIMASSMLVVSTFSLSVLASAYASAASAGTPRATRLVVADPRSQKAVAVFLAAFIFSMVGLIALGIGHYDKLGRLVLFVFALAVLAWVVVSFMLYIDVLSRIGQVAHTIDTVERAAWSALEQQARRPLGGAQPAEQPPEGALPLIAHRTGHVQFVDVEALQTLAEDHALRLHVAARAGDLVHPGAALAWWRADAADGTDGAAATLDADTESALREAFVVGDERTIEQDAGYGLIVLTEIAQRALSPAVNDPGTAIAVLGSQTRLLIRALGTPVDPEAPVNDRISAAPAVPAGLVPLAYEPVARCGFGHFEVIVQWLRHLEALVPHAPPAMRAAVQAMVQRMLQRAERAGADAADLEQWRQQAQALERLIEHGAPPAVEPAAGSLRTTGRR